MNRMLARHVQLVIGVVVASMTGSQAMSGAARRRTGQVVIARLVPCRAMMVGRKIADQVCKAKTEM